MLIFNYNDRIVVRVDNSGVPNGFNPEVMTTLQFDYICIRSALVKFYLFLREV